LTLTSCGDEFFLLNELLQHGDDASHPDCVVVTCNRVCL